jgi:hypothetical protein
MRTIANITQDLKHRLLSLMCFAEAFLAREFCLNDFPGYLCRKFTEFQTLPYFSVVFSAMMTGEQRGISDVGNSETLDETIQIFREELTPFNCDYLAFQEGVEFVLHWLFPSQALIALLPSKDYSFLKLSCS